MAGAEPEELGQDGLGVLLHGRRPAGPACPPPAPPRPGLEGPPPRGWTKPDRRKLPPQPRRPSEGAQLAGSIRRCRPGRIPSAAPTPAPARDWMPASIRQSVNNLPLSRGAGGQRTPAAASLPARPDRAGERSFGLLTRIRAPASAGPYSFAESLCNPTAGAGAPCSRARTALRPSRIAARLAAHHRPAPISAIPAWGQLRNPLGWRVAGYARLPWTAHRHAGRLGHRLPSGTAGAASGHHPCGGPRRHWGGRSDGAQDINGARPPMLRREGIVKQFRGSWP